MASTKKIIISCIATLLICALVTGVGYFLFLTPKINDLNTQVSTLQFVTTSNLHTVYLASADLKAGDTLTVDSLYQDAHYLQDAGYVIDESDIGKVLSVDIPQGEVLFKHYLFSPDDVQNDGRLVEYSCFTIPATAKVGGYIDIRIRFQNGEDYCVLPHKQLKIVDTGKNVAYLNVTDDETQLMASAIADQQLYSAYMYCTLYPYVPLYVESTVDYPLSDYNSRLTLAYNTLEVQDARRALVERLLAADTELNYSSQSNISNSSDAPDASRSNTNENGSIYDSDYTVDDEDGSGDGNE